jgi:hypothetical protein
MSQSRDKPPSTSRVTGDARTPRTSATVQRPLFPEVDGPEGPIGYTTRLLVATTLPHSRSDDNEFIRSSGLYDLCLLTPRRVGLPFGRYPRLVWVWVITEAVRRRSPLLYLPRTFSEFADQLGITSLVGGQGHAGPPAGAAPPAGQREFSYLEHVSEKTASEWRTQGIGPKYRCEVRILYPRGDLGMAQVGQTEPGGPETTAWAPVD